MQYDALVGQAPMQNGGQRAQRQIASTDPTQEKSGPKVNIWKSRVACILCLEGVVAVKRTCVIAPLLAALLLLCGCAAKVTPTTTTTSTATTAAPTTTVSSTSTTAAATSTVGTTFTAELSGAQVVPAVNTSATGSATFEVDATGTRVHFVLKVSNLSDVIASRVHEGEPGTNGQGLLILFPGPTQSGIFTGVLAQGNFNSSALIGSLTGKTVVDLVTLLMSGHAYVNVGTSKNPKGEIRGQIH